MQVAVVEPKLSSKVQKSVVRFMRHVGGCSLHTKASFSTYRSRWQALFPPLILCMCLYTYHTLAGTQMSTRKYTLCSYHTKAANLNWNVYVVL